MKFKVGDKVKLIKETECTLGFKKGDICKITEILKFQDNIKDIVKYPIKIENGTTIGFVDENCIELIEEEK